MPDGKRGPWGPPRKWSCRVRPPIPPLVGPADFRHEGLFADHAGVLHLRLPVGEDAPDLLGEPTHSLVASIDHALDFQNPEGALELGMHDAEKRVEVSASH